MLTKNSNLGKYKYSGYGLEFDSGLELHLHMGTWEKMLLFL